MSPVSLRFQNRVLTMKKPPLIDTSHIGQGIFEHVMHKAIRVGACIAALFFTCGPAFAHHVFSTEYDADKPVHLKGVVTRLDWVNPHAWLYVDVVGSDGKTTPWSLEFGSPGALMRRGVRKTDLPVGALVDVQGYLSKTKDTVINAVSVRLPDGRDFYSGSENTGAPPVPGAPKP